MDCKVKRFAILSNVGYIGISHGVLFTENPFDIQIFIDYETAAKLRDEMWTMWERTKNYSGVFFPYGTHIMFMEVVEIEISVVVSKYEIDDIITGESNG